jgi:hypothetical protein
MQPVVIAAVIIVPAIQGDFFISLSSSRPAFVDLFLFADDNARLDLISR